MGGILKVVVTGGAGFIGSNFVRRTLATRPDIKITVLDSLTYAGRLSNLEGLEGKYEFVQGDICNPEVVQSLVSKADVVVHFAAETRSLATWPLRERTSSLETLLTTPHLHTPLRKLRVITWLGPGCVLLALGPLSLIAATTSVRTNTKRN
jgi:hypothetical protein